MFKSRSVIFLVLLLGNTLAWAGPPFQTDDPEPVELHHYEAYVFSTQDSTRDGSTAVLPGFEFNLGAAPNLQLHAVVPMAYNSTGQGPITYGLGDMELGVKYRFIEEKPNRPQIGAFPMLEVPTGSARRGLGNGKAWARLPLWAQKSFGPWTTYGGGGYAVNTAAGMRSYPFGGALLQREIVKDRLILGGEFFGQGAVSNNSRATTFLDAGGYYTLRNNFLLLFMLGHSVAGDTHTIGYVGLYWTWGSKRKKTAP